MRILFFSDNFAPECCAPAIHVFERARLWASWGHQVTVITCAPNWPEGKIYSGYENRWRSVENIEGIRVIRVKTYIAANEGFLPRVLDYMSYMAPAFFTALAEPRPDIVISTSPQLFTPVAGLAYARLRRLPHVFELRDLWPASILATGTMKPGRVFRILERLELSLYRKSTRVVSVTNSYVEDLTTRGIPADKIDVVRNGTNFQLASPLAKDEELVRSLDLEGRFVVGYLGTIGLAHGLENVVETAELLKDKPITFLFVGWGAAKKRLEEMVSERGLKNVIFVPRQAYDDMPKYWSVCDAALVHTRKSELFRAVIPSKIFESMAMGLPLIYVGLTGEASSIIEHHKAGLIVEPEQPAALADAVLTLEKNPDLRSTLGAGGALAAPQYSRERHAKGTLAVLEKALATRGTKGKSKKQPKMKQVVEHSQMKQVIEHSPSDQQQSISQIESVTG